MQRTRPVLRALFLSVALSNGAVLALAQASPDTPASDSTLASRRLSDTVFTVPAAVGFVNDFANVLSDESEAELTRLVLEVREKSRGEIAIVTLPSLGGRTPQAVAMAIGNTWGVGFKGAPDDPRSSTGVVVLVAPVERHVRIELGTGAQAFISDALATDIAETMSPCFAKGDFAQGLRLGVTALALVFAHRFAFNLDTPEHLEPCSRG